MNPFSRPRVSRHKGILWIIEDDPEYLGVLCLLAERQGYSVLGTSSLEGAWKQLRSADRPPDSVICDYQLPDGTAEFWLREFRKRFPKSNLLCISGWSIPGLNGRLRQAGIPFQEKPMHLTEIFEMLRVGGH